MNKLGKFIKEKRLSRAMNQSQYAEKIGITVPTLRKIENGQRIGSATLRKLSAYTNISTMLLREMMILDE